MKIVVDTNVFISAIIGQSTPVKAILQACKEGRITLILSEPIIQELTDVLHRPTIQALHRFDEDGIHDYIEGLIANAEIVPGKISVRVSADPDDNMLFACAIDGKADYIISGDAAHVLPIPEFQGVKTIRPRDFYELVLNQIEKAA